MERGRGIPTEFGDGWFFSPRTTPRLYGVINIKPLRGFAGIGERSSTVPQGRHFINRRWSEAKSTDKTPPTTPHPVRDETSLPIMGGARGGLLRHTVVSDNAFSTNISLML